MPRSLSFQMVMLQEPETGKNDHLRQKRAKDKPFVYDRLFNEESAQVNHCFHSPLALSPLVY